LLFAQLSDPHVSAPGRLVYGRMETGRHLASAIARLDAVRPRPEFAIVTGDLVDFGTRAEYRELQRLLQASEVPIRLAIGNHDDRDAFFSVFGSESYLDPALGFVSYALEFDRFRVVTLDTHKPNEPYGELCPAQLAWLDAELGRAIDTPTVVALHHPPFAVGIWWMDAIGLKDSDQLALVLNRHPQVVRLLCGHLHRPVQSTFAGRPATVAPSTAHQTALDLTGDAFLTMTTEPPAFLLHRWTGEALLTHTVHCPPETGAPIDLPPGEGRLDQAQLKLYERKFREWHRVVRGYDAPERATGKAD